MDSTILAAIIVALIGGVFAIIAAIIQSRKSREKVDTDHSIQSTKNKHIDDDPLRKALQLSDNGDSLEAIKVLETAAKTESGRPLIHYNLGVLYQKLGKRDEAISHYRRATQLDDPYGDAYYNIGLLYYDSGLLEYARCELDMALKINPEHTGAMKAIGILEDRKGDNDSALEWFHKALELQPNDAEALNGLAESLKNAGQLEEALNRIKEARKLEPFNRTFQITEREIKASLEAQKNER